MSIKEKLRFDAGGRAVVWDRFRKDGRTLLQVKLDPQGRLVVGTAPRLEGWKEAEKHLERLLHSIGYPKQPPRLGKKRHPTRGCAFDLQAIYDRLNRAHFAGLLGVDICWSREAGVGLKRQSTIQFGSYAFDDRQIRINPVLDSPAVPLYYVEYVIYHEMCHAHVGIEHDKAGRPRYHGHTFKEWERRYRHYEAALAWEKANKDRFFAA